MFIVSAELGVTELDGEDAGELPTEFVATTVNVYAMPLVRPDTIIGELGPVAVIPPGFDITV
jgi:hypothetical protein